jgi:hypothetical protein
VGFGLLSAILNVAFKLDQLHFRFLLDIAFMFIILASIILYHIKERTVLGTKAYYANLKFFKSRLVTRQPKLKLYRTVKRPIVTYALETWVLKEAIIQKLLVFERKILRKIFESTKENEIWRVKTSEELDKLIKHKNIIKLLKPSGFFTYCQV